MRKIGFLAMSFILLSVEANAKSLKAERNACGHQISAYEKQHNIPEGLLHAISKVESGRKDHLGNIVAWPWTVNAEGVGSYYATKEQAVEAVRKMQRQGIKSIDVGCMQINLYHHPHAFKSLSDAFEPVKNVAYAARFLTGLKKEHASWHTAVAHYHSANPFYHVPYRKNVMLAWQRDQKAGEKLIEHPMFDITPRPLQVNRIRRVTRAKVLKVNKDKPMVSVTLRGGEGARVKRVTRANSARLNAAHSRRLSGPKKVIRRKL